MSKTYVDTSIGYYQDIVAKRQEIDSLNQFMEQQKLHYESVMENAKNATSSYLSAIFTSLQVDAIILAIDDNNSIQVAISPEIKNIITADGINGRIKIPKQKKIETVLDDGIENQSTLEISSLEDGALIENSQKDGALENVPTENRETVTVEEVSETYLPGIIIPDVDGSFYFEIGKDEEGNPLPVDFSVLSSGMGIEVVGEIIN